MPIVRFDPFRSFMRPTMWDEEWPELTISKGLNVYEEDNKVIVEAAVPGISEDNIDIIYEDGVLTISAREEKKEEEKKKNRVVHREERVTSFSYTTYLPRAVEAGKIDATVDNGVLKVTAPVTEAAKAKKIPVKAGLKKK
jgi:HSP20 family protein